MKQHPGETTLKQGDPRPPEEWPESFHEKYDRIKAQRDSKAQEARVDAWTRERDKLRRDPDHALLEARRASERSIEGEQDRRDKRYLTKKGTRAVTPVPEVLKKGSER